MATEPAMNNVQKAVDDFLNLSRLCRIIGGRLPIFFIDIGLLMFIFLTCREKQESLYRILLIT